MIKRPIGLTHLVNRHKLNLLLQVFLKRQMPREERRAGCTGGKQGGKGKERPTGEGAAAGWLHTDRRVGWRCTETEVPSRAPERQRCCELRPKENPGRRKRTLAHGHASFLSF